MERAVIEGTIVAEDIPEIRTNAIRVFICSSAPDTVEERNILVENVYHKLQQYARDKYGLEFLVVDLHWGIRDDEIWFDHKYNEFAQEQVRRCCRTSAGPYFAAILGQNYGKWTLPRKIECETMEVILSGLRHHRNKDTRDFALLTTWYKLDENDVPASYVLTDVSEIFPNISNKENLEENSEANAKWSEIEGSLRRLIRKGVEYCTENRQIDDMARHNILMSDLDRELETCIVDGNNAENSCLVFNRNIVDVKNYINDERSATFVKLEYNEREEKMEVDKESLGMLHDVIEKKISSWLPEQNLQKFEVLWKFDDGINADLHVEYLHRFANIFHDKMIDLIDRHTEKYPKEVNEYSLYQQVLQHWNMTKNNSKNFYMRDDILETIKDYIFVDTNQPLVLYGEVGVGTTAIISKAQTEVVSWLEDFYIVSRIVALSPSFERIRDIIHSVCTQILELTTHSQNQVPKSGKLLQDYFENLLNSVPKNKTLILFFEGLERLSPDDNAHKMYWIPETLKSNVKIIVTTDPVRHKILANLKTRYENHTHFIEVERFQPSECLAIVDAWLENDGRRLTNSQRNMVQNLFQNCSSSAFMKLAFDMVKEWPSYYLPKTKSLPCDPNDWINSIFDQLEEKHGKTVVSRSISYLTATNTGISDFEILDILSLDDDVLSEIYHIWHPPVRRMPILPWLQVKKALSPLLTEKNVEGVTVTWWGNDMYRQIATIRYMHQTEFRREIHRNMADYFLGIWHKRKKPFLLPESLVENQHLPFCAAEADRLVPSQPSRFGDDEVNAGFNQRKFDQVPQHLFLSNKFNELNKLVLFNYEWLYNKTKALSIHHILNDFSLNPSIETSLVEEALQAAMPVIEENVNNLAVELSGRLLSYYQTYDNIRELIKQCDKSGLQHSAILPSFSYHQKPGSPLKMTINIEQDMQFFALSADGRYVTAKNRVDSEVKVFDVKTGENISTIDVSVGDLYVTPDEKFFILVDHITKMVVKVHDAKSGDFVGQLIPANHISLKPRDKVTLSKICVSNEYLCLLVSSDISYLCIAEVSTCNFLQILGLDGRASICEISPDSSVVMVNASTSILSYSLRTLQHVGTAVYDSTPVAIAFTSDGNKAFWLDGKENKITAMLMKNGVTDISYRVVMEHAVTMDTVTHISVSPNNKYVIVRGQSTILVYNIKEESIQTRCYRPFDIPKEFRLPRSTLVQLVFTGAEFSRNSLEVIGTIFRNIYIWSLEDSSLLKTLQAPVGVITSLLVIKTESCIITHQEGSYNLHVWNIDENLSESGTLDKLTHPITEMQLTADDRLCVVKCKNSDELGIIDIATGALTDLLTHIGPVNSFTITPDGQYIFVSIKAPKACTVNKIWSVVDRAVVYEFGSIPAYATSTKGSDAFYVFYQEESPGGFFRLRKFCLDIENLREINFTNTVANILCEPFVTEDDNHLVLLSADEFDGLNARYINPTIRIYNIGNNDEESPKVEEETASSDVLSTLLVNFQRILQIRPSNYANVILIMYVSLPEEKHEESVRDDCLQRGLILFDVSSKMVNHVCENFFGPTVPLDHRLLFSSDLTYCIDFQSNIFDLASGFYIKQLANGGAQPWALALGGRVAIFIDDSELFALRVEDEKEIARCNIHSKINCILVGSDERTVAIGCDDGRVQSYVIIDERYEDRAQIIQTIPSRTPSSELKRYKSWDKIDDMHRPSSSTSNRSGKTDKEILDEIAPIPRFRPQSDTFLYLNPKSQSCAVM